MSGLDAFYAEAHERHERMMRLVEQLRPETRARIAQGMDDRFHEVTGTPREEDPR